MYRFELEIPFIYIHASVHLVVLLWCHVLCKMFFRQSIEDDYETETNGDLEEYVLNLLGNMYPLLFVLPIYVIQVCFLSHPILSGCLFSIFLVL
jgi:membrane protein CcdC involved in cytochrome C biogenesis